MTDDQPKRGRPSVALQRFPARHSWRVSLSNTSKHSPSECTRILGSSRWKRSTTLGHVNRSVEPIAKRGPSYSLSLWIAAASKALAEQFQAWLTGAAGLNLLKAAANDVLQC
jgi:hypothetical protein